MIQRRKYAGGGLSRKRTVYPCITYEYGLRLNLVYPDHYGNRTNLQRFQLAKILIIIFCKVWQK